MDLSIIIPAYNEALRLPSTLDSIRLFFQATDTAYEIIVVDDGSTDTTASVVTNAASVNQNIKLITYRQNEGKGFAVRRGVEAAQGALILIDDADGSSPIAEVDRLMAAILNGADVAIGSRNLVSADCVTVSSVHRKWIGNSFNLIVQFLLTPGIKDTQCGFKLFTAPVGKHLFRLAEQNRFAFDVEILFYAMRNHYKIAEVPINWSNVTGSKVNLVADSANMFFEVLKIATLGRLRLERDKGRINDSSRATTMLSISSSKSSSES